MPWNIDHIISKVQAKLAKRSIASEVVDQHIVYHRAVLRDLERDHGADYPAAEYVGMGGSGVAVKLIAAHGGDVPIEKCVKYPQPTAGQSTPFSLADVLDREAEALKTLHHEHIIPLDFIGRLALDDANISDRDKTVPYYIMPFVRSVELPEYAKSAEATAVDLVRLLREIASALDYMHRAGFVHLDVKPENVFVQAVGDHPTALLADFGFCKRLTPGLGEETMVMVTDGYVHPELEKLMINKTDTDKNRIRDKVSRAELRPAFDRFAFGVTIINALVTFLRADAHRRSVPTGLLRGLHVVAMRCSDGYPNALRNDEDQQRITSDDLFHKNVADALRYSSTDELLRNMTTLASSFREYALEPEIADVASKIICLPPRTFAQLSPRVEHTLDSTLMRRMANVAQLALCYHVYPGAAHTRKEHMLGTYENAATLLRHLLFDSENPVCALLLTEKHQRLTLLGALLHDFGHIPLMHELEDAFPELRHETYMREVIDGYWGDAAFQQEIDDICAHWGIDRDDLRSIFGATSDAGNWRARYDSLEMEFVRSILDGAIDVDKIDYLQRDALHAGVQYGHGVDVQRLERRATGALWVTLENTVITPRFRLAAWQSAQPAAEAVISARHNMHAQVYAHRTVRAARSMLNYVAWCWAEAPAYQGLEGKAIVDRLFKYASLLEGPMKQMTLRGEPEVAEPRLSARDNLPYAESRVCRWMAAVSGQPSAVNLAEALISRDLYKEVRALEESAVLPFLDRAYPPSRGGVKFRERSAFGPSEWIELTRALGSMIRVFLKDRQSALSRPVAKNDITPEVLLDVAIPKTMRTQRELVIVSDRLGDEVSWRRLEQLQSGHKGTILGLEVTPSPIYDFFGGRASGDRASRILVRLFARPDIADALRTHLDGSVLAGWLNAFVPPDSTRDSRGERTTKKRRRP